MRYLIGSEHGWLGGFGFGAAALQLRDRDQWIGWDARTRRQHLHRVVGMSRFLIRTSVRCQNTGATRWTKPSPGYSGTTGLNCTRHWPMSARCGSKKTGMPINLGKPAHERLWDTDSKGKASRTRSNIMASKRGGLTKNVAIWSRRSCFFKSDLPCSSIVSVDPEHDLRQVDANSSKRHDRPPFSVQVVDQSVHFGTSMRLRVGAFIPLLTLLRTTRSLQQEPSSFVR